MSTTWRKLLTEALEDNKESFGDIISITLSNDELDEEFYAGYGSCEGKPFTAWTEDRVYFPVGYDGSEWVDSVPRNPCSILTSHIGGGI